jgi:uncharacterized protein (AIM24 family)
MEHNSVELKHNSTELISNKLTETCIGETAVFSINGAGKIWYSPVKELN